MLPPDVYNIPFGANGSPSERVATKDLQQARFLVFQIEHRLAPGHGFLPGQDYTHGSLGHPPDQTDDVKRQILAALADSQCNGSIYLVGGSAGGCLALWCALDPASDGGSGAVAGWGNDARLHIKAVVSLSGPTNLDNWNNPGGISDDDLIRFESSLDNYVGLPKNPPDHTHATLLSASPYSLVANALSSPPVTLYGCQGDPVPYEQANVMFNALFNKYGVTLDLHVNILNYTVDGTDHAYTYWHELNTNTGICVSHEVIAFLQSHP